MVVDDTQFLSILKGKRIKLTLRNASFLGVVQRINSNKTIVLSDVTSASNGDKYPGSKMFFGHEIINVEFSNKEGNDSGVKSIQEEQLIIERFQPYRRAEALDYNEEDDAEYINFVIVDEFHDKFGQAVMQIKKQQVISVGADGVEIYKHGRLCWLQIATKHKVYLFDILLLGARAFKNGLSMILQSKHILKVIHDCRAIAGCLSAQFGVDLTNVFDTQVADVMCFYSETGGLFPDRVSTLQEVINLHLRVPLSQLLSLEMKTELSQDKEMWYKRPCPLPLLKVMALSVIHLQPLRLVLLDTIMMDYMLLVDSYLKSSHFQPDELEHITMESVLELPKELQQLEQMRCERQERAAMQFPVTEKGFLERFNPKKLRNTAAESEQERPKPEPKCTEISTSPSASLGTGEKDSQSTSCAVPEKSPFSFLPGIGRGLFLQAPPAQIPGGTPENTASVHKEPNESSKSLSQSFRSFRD